MDMSVNLTNTDCHRSTLSTSAVCRSKQAHTGSEGQPPQHLSSSTVSLLAEAAHDLA